MDYARQLAYKQAKAVEVLKPFGHVQPIEGAPKPWEYRCKTHVVFGSRGGEVITGYYRPFSHALIPVDRCRLEHPAASELIRALREIASALRIRPFDDERMTGFLRHAVIRKGDFPPVLDVEPPEQQIERIGGDEELMRRIAVWMQIVERRTGMRPILYVSQMFINTHMKHADDIKRRYNVWIARYGQYKPDVKLVYWQLCPDGRVQGITGPVDINVFNGYQGQFEEFVRTGFHR